MSSQSGSMSCVCILIPAPWLFLRHAPGVKCERQMSFWYMYMYDSRNGGLVSQQTLALSRTSL